MYQIRFMHGHHRIQHVSCYCEIDLVICLSNQQTSWLKNYLVRGSIPMLPARNLSISYIVDHFKCFTYVNDDGIFARSSLIHVQVLF